MQGEKRFYLVREDLLPEALAKTARAKDMISQGKASTVKEAVTKVGIARSTFYKYKDGVFVYMETEDRRILNISLLLVHRPGVLSEVVNYVAALQGNILMINQSLPLQGKAQVTLSVDITDGPQDVDEFLRGLSLLGGVLASELTGRS